MISSRRPKKTVLKGQQRSKEFFVIRDWENQILPVSKRNARGVAPALTEVPPGIGPVPEGRW